MRKNIYFFRSLTYTFLKFKVPGVVGLDTINLFPLIFCDKYDI